MLALFVLMKTDILIGHNKQVVVADYGLSALYEDMRTLTSVVLVGWTAPELFNGGTADHKSTVFSFAVLMYEVSFRSFSAISMLTTKDLYS